MSFAPVDAVEVRLWGLRVGALAADPASGYYAFEYAPAWLRRGLEFAPLTMPLAPATYVFPGLARDTFHGLPAAIADALPDAFGNGLVEAYLARRGLDPRAITPLDRLAYQANRGMGGLEFRPPRAPQRPSPTALDLAELVGAARATLRGETAGASSRNRALRALIRVGTSAGGARAKAVVAWNPTTGELRSGQFPAPEGFEDWLLKFDGVGPAAVMAADGETSLDDFGLGAGYGRVEHAYAAMARAAGIDVPPTRLLEEGGRAHFMIRRFDRLPGGRKLHVQSLCGLAGVDFRAIGVNDYAQLFTAMRALGLGEPAAVQAFRRMAFNVAAANCDDHSKNVSFLMTPGGAWSLAPAYDLTHSYSPTSRWTSQHLMSVNGAFRGIRAADLMSVADRFAIPGARAAIRDVRAAVANWPDFARAARVPPAQTAAIAADHQTMAL
jgi:serine/threonine-protein kinase HipA